MTDRELIELAAKACGYTIRENGKDINGEIWYWCEQIADCWNPLNDDGDALRLAVAIAKKCAMALVWQGGTVQFRAQPFDSWINGEDSRDYAESATRRAIVRVAAEIGKDM